MTMTIGMLAQRSGVKIPTIRYYESIGLLRPPARTASGYRRYGVEDEARLIFIRRARELGFSIDQIKQLARLSDQDPLSCKQAQGIAAEQLVAVKNRMADLRRLQRLLTTMISQCDQGKLGPCPVIGVLSGTFTGT